AGFGVTMQQTCAQLVELLPVWSAIAAQSLADMQLPGAPPHSHSGCGRASGGGASATTKASAGRGPTGPPPARGSPPPPRPPRRGASDRATSIAPTPSRNTTKALASFLGPRVAEGTRVSPDSLLDIWRHALATAVEVGAPFVGAALIVGLLAALLMAATQLNEGAVTFVPKVAALALVLRLRGPWLLSRLVRFTQTAADQIVEVGRGRR